MKRISTHLVRSLAALLLITLDSGPAVAAPAGPGVTGPAAKARARPAPGAPLTPARFSFATRAGSGGVVIVETAIGDVRVTARPGAPEAAVRVGQKLGERAVVRTGRNGRVFLRFSATDVVRLSSRTEIRIAALHVSSRPDRPMTVMAMLTGRARAMLKRRRPSPAPDFAISAGGSICAVKGTDFEETVRRESDGAVTVTLRVDAGTVVMLNAGAGTPGGGLTAAEVSAALARGTGQVSVSRGQGTRSEGGGAVQAPAPVAPRTALELVALTPGTRVQVTVNGVTTELVAGDEVPPGAAVRITGGEAVLSSGGNAVAAGDGASFTYAAAVTPGAGGTSEVQVIIVVADDSRGGVGVESGGSTSNLNPGDSAVSRGSTGIAVTPGAHATTDGAGEGSQGNGTPGGTTDEPLPDLPTLDSDGAAPPPASDDAPPPPPPDTVNQDVPTVSPSAP